MPPDAAWSPPGPPVRTRGGADIIPTRGIGGGARRSVVSVEGIETDRLTRLRRILPRASSAKGGFIIGDVPRRRRGHPGRVPTDGARHDPRRDGPPTNGRRRRARVTLRRDRTIIQLLRGAIQQQQLHVQLPERRVRRRRRRDTTPAQHFEYTAQSRGVHDGRQAVTETKRSYRDSTGRERHGVARTVGDRGRRVTRERDGSSGEERCEDRLLATEDGDGFDRDWSAAAEAAQLMNPRRFPSLDALASELTSDAFPFALTRGRSTHAGGRAPEPADGDRRIASAARETHAARTRGLAEEARRMAGR